MHRIVCKLECSSRQSIKRMNHKRIYEPELGKTQTKSLHAMLASERKINARPATVRKHIKVKSNLNPIIG